MNWGRGPEADRPRYYTRLLEALGRETSSGRFIPAVDGLRFLAIMAVLLQHASGYFAAKTPLTAGMGESQLLERILALPPGVPLFFAISGFILAVPFAEHHLGLSSKSPRLRDYYFRRLTRLEPPYIVNLVVRYALMIWIAGQSAAALAPNLLASLFYSHNAIYGQGSRINPVAWSLEVEVQFYVVAPLLAQVFRLRQSWRRVALGLGIIGFTVLYAGVLHQERQLGLTLLHQAQYFLLGLLVADLYLASWRTTNLAGHRGYDMVALCGLVLGLCSMPLDLWHWIGPLSIFMQFVGALRGLWWRALLERREIVVIGGMCYSIYLWHYAVLSNIGGKLFSLAPTGHYILDGTALSIVAIFLTLPPCAILFLLLEKPFMRRKWWRRRR